MNNSEDLFLQRFLVLQIKVIEILTTNSLFIKPGITELDLKDQIEKDFHTKGISGFWYPTLVYAGNWTGTPFSRRFHQSSNEVRVQESDIVIVDVTPLRETIWANYCYTHLVEEDKFFRSLINDNKTLLEDVKQFALTKASSHGDIYFYCMDCMKKLNLELIGKENVGHAIFELKPNHKKVDDMKDGERIYIGEEHQDLIIDGLLSIEPQVSRINPKDGIRYGSKFEEIIFAESGVKYPFDQLKNLISI